MTTNQTIDGVLVPRELLSYWAECLESAGFKDRPAEMRALLDAPVGFSTPDCPDCAYVQDGQCLCIPSKPAAQPQGEPVAFTAVGVLRDDGDGGLEPEWILEGGTAELWAGAVLLVADEDQDLCAEDGHCELYREQPAPVEVVLPDRDSLRDIIAQAIGVDTYDCTRVWSAWGIGTMSDDDFIKIVDQEERLYEIADACLNELTRINTK